MRYIAICLILIVTGCSGTRFSLPQHEQAYGLSTSELLVLDTMDKALDELEDSIEADGLPEGKTASLEILGVNGPANLYPYVRRLVSARLENRGLEILKERKVVPEGGSYYDDGDFEYWSSGAGKSAQVTTGAGKGAELSSVRQRLLSGAKAMLAPQEGEMPIPDLRLVLAFRMAGVDVKIKDIGVFEEHSLLCRVHAKLCAFADSKAKVYEGASVSPEYVYNRKILKFIPLPAPYKELETDRRSVLRKLLDGIMGASQTTQGAVAQTRGMTAGM